MKNRIIPYMLLIPMCFSSISCSFFKNISEKEQDKKHSVVISDDRESLHPQKKSTVYTPEELAKGVVKGDWAIETVFGKKAVGETAPYLKFDPEQKRVYGSNGCNYINATYSYNSTDSTLNFSNIVSTMRACAMQGITDYEINNALDQTGRYSWRMDGTQYFLQFFSKTGIELMTLMHQNFNFLNGTWMVEMIKDKTINVPGSYLVPDMKLVIDIDEGKVHGNTGCNILNGILKTDMEMPNSISFEQLATTRRACPDDAYESDFLVALEEVITARPATKDKVDMINSNGQVVLRLVRSTDK